MTDNTEETPEKKIPLWVMLAFSNIHARKTAWIIIASCVVFTIYCIPWVNFTDSAIVETLFLFDDWSWVAMMVGMCAYYYACLLWMDENEAWDLLAED